MLCRRVLSAPEQHLIVHQHMHSEQPAVLLTPMRPPPAPPVWGTGSTPTHWPSNALPQAPHAHQNSPQRGQSPLPLAGWGLPCSSAQTPGASRSLMLDSSSSCHRPAALSCSSRCQEELFLNRSGLWTNQQILAQESMWLEGLAGSARSKSGLVRSTGPAAAAL